jgi:hypothetical protein
MLTGFLGIHMDAVRTSDIERFLRCAAGLSSSANPPGCWLCRRGNAECCLRIMKSKKAEFGPPALALGEFVEIETDSEGKFNAT